MHRHSIFPFSLEHAMNFVELILLLGWLFILDEGGWAGSISLFLVLLSESIFQPLNTLPCVGSMLRKRGLQG